MVVIQNLKVCNKFEVVTRVLPNAVGVKVQLVFNLLDKTFQQLEVWTADRAIASGIVFSTWQNKMFLSAGCD